MPNRKPAPRPPGGRDDGMTTAFTAVLAMSLLVVVGLSTDAGRALDAKSQAGAVAEEAARAGAEEVDLAALRHGDGVRLNREAAVRAADSYLARAGVEGTASADARSVTVSVRTSTPTTLLRLIGLGSLQTTNAASADAHVEGVQ